MEDDLFAPETVTFDSLVGDGKKFKDPDSLAKGKAEADKHIARLEKELSELRGDLQTRMTVEAMLEKIQTPRTPATPPTPEPGNVLVPERHEPGSLNIADEVSKILRQEKSKEVAEANLTVVRQEMKKRFGADYNQKLASIADDLSVSKEFLTDMAKKSPTGFMKLVDSVATPDKDLVTPPSSAFNPSAGGMPTGSKNYKYYSQLRKEHPDIYHSKKIQMEMNREAVRQGAAFYQ